MKAIVFVVSPGRCMVRSDLQQQIVTPAGVTRDCAEAPHTNTLPSLHSLIHVGDCFPRRRLHQLIGPLWPPVVDLLATSQQWL